MWSSELAVRAMINGQLRLRNLRTLIATSNPSISGMWRSRMMTWKDVAEGPRALRHSKPVETVDTWQRNFSSSFLVTILFTSSSSARRTCRPSNIVLGSGCSEGFLYSKIRLLIEDCF
nr:hypothetical protein Iba_chr14bCG3520 [Ipomoea batatas]